MDKNKKIIAAITGATLFLSVAFFVFLIANYTPPVREVATKEEENQDFEPVYDEVLPEDNDGDVSSDGMKTIPIEMAPPNNQQNENIEKNDSGAINNPQTNEDLTNTPGQITPPAGQVSPAQPGKQNILIVLKDFYSTPVSGMNCRLYAKEDALIIFNRTSSTNGECFFYDLPMGKTYFSDITKNGVFYDRVVMLETCKSESLCKRQWTIMTGIQNDRVDKKCTDSDNGYEPYVSGQASYVDQDGLTPKAVADQCVDQSILQEAVCDRNAYANNSLTFSCPKGCMNGACVK